MVWNFVATTVGRAQEGDEACVDRQGPESDAEEDAHKEGVHNLSPLPPRAVRRASRAKVGRWEALP